MQRNQSSILTSKRQAQKRDDRGIALITTLLLLMLLSALTLAMAWSTRSDMLINGYYRNFRGSFYAADSGLNVMRQALNDEFTPGSKLYPASFVIGTNPLAGFDGPGGKLKSDLEATYGNINLTSSSSGFAAKSWPESYKATIDVKLTGCTASNGKTNVDCTKVAFPADATSASYVFSYTITSVGQSHGTENTTLTDNGVVQVTATLNTPPAITFAAYGMFIDQFKVCSGDLIPGSVTGPVFTNGSWTFGTGSYTFWDKVSQAQSDVGFDNGGCAALPNASSDPAKGIAPTFKAGGALTTNAPAVALPQNVFQQAQAVLDGRGADNSPAPTPSTMNPVLKDASKKPYPSGSTPSSGVFLPYSVDAKTGAATFTGGGIMVEGDASVVLQPVGSSVQQYTITQGSGSSTVVTTITVNSSTNQTVMTSVPKIGVPSTVTISGVPTQRDQNTGSVIGPATMLFVDGNVTSLSGPGPNLPALQDGTALTITSANNTSPTTPTNINVTGDLLYNKRPVTDMSTNPPDQLIPANDTRQTLGIYTPLGDVVLVNNLGTGSNLEIDASIATLSNNGKGGITTPSGSNQFGTVTIVGGRIQNTIKTINTKNRNILFDKRYGPNFAPPWFPAGKLAGGTTGGGLGTPVMTRLQWLNTNATY